MKKNIRKLHESFQHALRGLWLCIRAERNFRVHIVAAFFVALFAWMGHATVTDCAVLSICFGLTMGAELMNTAIERLCDKQVSGYDALVRNAKDIAAAGVFVCALSCVIVGLFLFIGKGILFEAFLFIKEYIWMTGVLLFSAILSLCFIFKYGRMQ